MEILFPQEHLMKLTVALQGVFGVGVLYLLHPEFALGLLLEPIDQMGYRTLFALFVDLS